jgi:hypothetical protein
MTIRLSDGLRTKIVASGLLDAFDTTGRINLYTGSQPATAATAASGTLLGTLTLASDSASAGAAGVCTFNTVTSDTSADASGTAGWGRVYLTGDTVPGSTADSDDKRLDFSVGTSGADVNFDTVTFVAGGTIAISSLSITLPSGA